MLVGLYLNLIRISNQLSILSFSSKVSEHKNSSIDVIRALHDRMNSTFSGLRQKIDDLAEEFSDRRHRAMEALLALNRGVVHTVERETTEDVVTPVALRKNETKDETPATPSVLLRY